MVLSGMSNYEQLADNVSYMKDFQPFTSAEYKAVERVREILKQQDSIPWYGLPLLCAGLPEAYSHPRPGSAVTTPKNSLETGTATSITET